MIPDQINATHRQVIYRCRACQAESGLRWFAGTSCPVCSKPECSAVLTKEIEEAFAADAAMDEYARERGYL